MNRSNAADKRRRRAARRGQAPSRLLLPALAVVAVLFGGGLALGTLQSLGYTLSAGTASLTLEHFARVLGDPDFLQSLGLTFYIALTSTAAALGISIAAALGFNAMARRSRIVYFVFQIPLTVPHLVIAVAVAFLLAPTGMLSRAALHAGLIDSSAAFPLMINDRWGIGILAAYVWKEVPFITLMILSVLRATGSELLEVGRTLKAGRWQCFRHITLPIISPSLGAAALIVFAYTFGAFEVPFLLGRTYPMMLPVWAYKNYSDVDLLARPEGIAAGMVIAVVVGLTVVLSQIMTHTAQRRGVAL